MRNLFSSVPPLILDQEMVGIRESIISNMRESDELMIAVGYVSKEGLAELDSLIRENEINKITLIIGMYSVDGFPESIYNEIKNLHSLWKSEGVGEIFLVNNMNYHGKIFSFIKDSRPYKAINGSANLSVLAPAGATVMSTAPLKCRKTAI